MPRSAAHWNSATALAGSQSGTTASAMKRPG